MDWNALRNKRTSVSGISALPQLYPQHPLQHQPSPRYAMAPGFGVVPDACRTNTSYYASQHPLFCADWISAPGHDLVALSSFREGFSNRIQVVSGQGVGYDSGSSASSPSADISAAAPTEVDQWHFSCVAEAAAEYPVTRLQWEPRGHERLAASSDVLRLYRLGAAEHGEPALVQTHLLANNSTAGGGAGGGAGVGAAAGSGNSGGGGLSGNGGGPDTSHFPPVTAFDWNTADPSVLITSSVDTTCTVWDLSRSRAVGSGPADSAQVKTQLIAHDSEVFDVKFLHMSTDVFASVSNDGSMRVFDLRSLEHSTIVYEPAPSPGISGGPTTSGGMADPSYNPQALLRLSACHADQNLLATIAVNSNQVLIIDLRMPGVPVVTLDGSYGGTNSGAINSVTWHPSAKLLATGGDDCQALVWDCTGASGHRPGPDAGMVIDTPVLAYAEDLEVNNVCWKRGGRGSWMGVVSGRGFQALDAS